MGDLKPFAESLKFTQAVNELGNVINLEQSRYVFFLFIFLRFQYLSHFFSVGLGIKRSFCQQNRVFLRRYSKLIVESVMPDLKCHVI